MDYAERLTDMREALGSFEARVDLRFSQVDSRFEQIDNRFEQVERRFEQVDRRFEQVDRRFEQVDGRFDALDAKLSRHFMWLAGLYLTTLAAVVAALVAR